MTYEKIDTPILDQLEKVIKKYKVTNLIFFGALFAETILLIVFFPYLLKSAIFAVTLAALLITFFSFYTLRNYQFSEKESTMRELIQKYLRGVESLFQGKKSPIDIKHIYGEACLSLAHETSLRRQVKALPKWLPLRLAPLYKRGVYFIEGDDFLKFRSQVLLQAIEEITQEIRFDPCALNPHLCLAFAWTELAATSKELFKDSMQKALEEYKLLNDLAPDNLQILYPLSNCLKAMEDREGEIAALERIRELDPHDPDLLLRLGILYFSRMETAKGFRLYEMIKSIDSHKSDELMTYYR